MLHQGSVFALVVFILTGIACNADDDDADDAADDDDDDLEHIAQ